MKRIICTLLLALLPFTAMAQNDWPQDSVRKSLDYLYDRIVVLSGGSSNFVGTLTTEGGLLSYTKDGTDYTLILTTNAVRQAISNHFLATNAAFGGAVTGQYANLGLNVNFSGVVTGRHTNLAFSVPVVADVVAQGILSGSSNAGIRYVSLTADDLRSALASWALATNTVFAGVVTGKWDQLNFNSSVVWTNFGAGDMGKWRYDADDDGRIDAVDSDGVDTAALQDESVTGDKLADYSVDVDHFALSVLAGDLARAGDPAALYVDGLHGAQVPDPADPESPQALIADGFGGWAFVPLPVGDMSKSVYDTVAPGDGVVDAALHADTADTAASASGLNSKPVEMPVAGHHDMVLTYDAVSQTYEHRNLVQLGLENAVLDVFDADDNGVLDAADHAVYADSAAAAAYALTADRLLNIPFSSPPAVSDTVLTYDSGMLTFKTVESIGAGNMLKSVYDMDEDGTVDTVDPDGISGEHVLDESLTGDDVADGSLSKLDLDGSVLTEDTSFSGDVLGIYSAMQVTRLKGATLPVLAASNHNKVLVFRYPGEFRLMTVENLSDTAGYLDMGTFGAWVTNTYEVATNDLWAAINYVLPTVSLTKSGAHSAGSYDKGQVVSSFTLAWAVNKPMTSRVLSMGAYSYDVGAGSGGSLGYSGLMSLGWPTITANSSIAVTVGDGDNTAASSTSFAFYDRMYYGFSSVESGISDAQIRALTSAFATSRARTVPSVDPGGLSKYLWVCYPTAWGTASFRINGFPVDGWLLSARTFVNTYGYSAMYNIYRAPYPSSVAVSLEVY